MARTTLTTVLALSALLLACTGVIAEPPEADEVAEVGAPKTNQMPGTLPGDGDPIVDLPAAESCDESDLDPGPALARRLTRVEYINTVRDVVGVDVSSDVHELLPEDLRAEGFTNTANALIVSLPHVEAYSELSRRIVAGLGDAGTFTSTFGECTDFTEACIGSYVNDLGLRLFRRPLTADEAAVYAPIFDAVAAENDPFSVATELTLRAMLQAPQFLYRLEDQEDVDGSGIKMLSDYEIASRLSYLLWASAPDDALYASARIGTLSDPATIASHVGRMLLDDRARAASMGYMRDWLELEAMEEMSRDADLYPQFDSEMAAAMARETVAVLDHILWEQDAPLLSMYAADFTIAEPAIAELYGFEAGEGETMYDLSDVPERRGILSQPGLLMLSGRKNEPSLVRRGLYVFENILCGTVVAPPAAVIMAAGPPEPGVTERVVSQRRIDDSACTGCHSQFDPLAYAFEGFDGIGVHHVEDDFGNVLRSDGTFVTEHEAVDYTTVEEFAVAAAGSERAAECMVMKPLQFSLGRRLQASDACTVSAVKDAYEADGATWEALMTAIATHPSFVRVRAEVSP